MDGKTIVDFDRKVNEAWGWFENLFRLEKSLESKMIFVFLAYIVKEEKLNLAQLKIEDLCDCIEDTKLKNYIKDNFIEKLKQMADNMFKLKLSSLLWDYDKPIDSQIIKEYLLSLPMGAERQYWLNYDFCTPKSMVKLAVELLNIQPNDKVIDNCCGLGTFIGKAYTQEPESKYYGIDLNESLDIIFRIKKYVTKGGVDFAIGDVLTRDYNEKFDKGFTHFPLKISKKDMLYEFGNNQYEYFINTFGRDVTVGWWYTYKLLDALKEDGEGISVMLTGDLSNVTNHKIREKLVQSNKIKAVILLPNNLVPHTPISISFLIIGENKDGVIKFVDASNVYQPGRRINEFIPGNIKTILEAYNKESYISKFVDKEEITKPNYILDPRRYFETKVYYSSQSNNNVVETVCLCDLLEVPATGSTKGSIRRGAQLSAEDLDERMRRNDTGYKHLSISDIHDGIIDEHLEFIDTIHEREEKYRLKNGDLVITKNGFPPKIAVVEVKENERILANGNLFIVRLNKDKCDPYFIKAYLESYKGLKALKNAMIEKPIPYIDIDNLLNIAIPKIPLNEQQHFSKQYQKQLQKIKDAKKELARLVNSFNKID